MAEARRARLSSWRSWSSLLAAITACRCGARSWRSGVKATAADSSAAAALARSDAAAAAVTALGATMHRGDLDDLDGLSKAAADSDGVIHLAFNHEQMRSGDYVAAIAADLAAVEALGDALAGTGKPLVGTSGTLAPRT